MGASLPNCTATRLFGICVLGCVWGCQPQPPAPVKPPSPLDPLAAAKVQVLYERALLNPADAERHGQLGAGYEANEIWDYAARSFANAASLDPQEPVWRVHQAHSLRRLGQASQAQNLVEGVLSQHPTYAPALDVAGHLALESGALEKARELFEKCLGQLPEAISPRVGLGDCYVRNQEFGRAIEVLESLVREHESVGAAHYLLGLAYRGAGQPDRARPFLARAGDRRTHPIPDRVFELHPQYRANLIVYVDRATRELEQGNALRAVQILEAVRPHHPNDLGLLNNLSAAYLRQGRTEDALTTVDTVLQKNPRDPRAYHNKAQILSTSGQLDEALLCADSALAISPQIATFHNTRARILLASGYKAEAIHAFEEATQRDPNLGTAFHSVAEIHMQENRLEKALLSFEKAHQLLPHDVHAGCNLCVVQGKLGRFDSAQQTLSEVLERFPQHARVRDLVVWLEQLQAGGKRP